MRQLDDRPSASIAGAAPSCPPPSYAKRYPPMITQVQTRQIEPDITVIELHGQLHAGNTLLSVESTIKKTITAGARKIVLDLSGLRTIDSSGIGVLVVASALAKQNQGQLRAAAASGSVSNTLNLVQIGQVLPSDPDVETACRNFA